MLSFAKVAPYRIAARGSRLSRIQVQEVLEELRKSYPFASFIPVWVKTSGDKDQNRSLRDLGKTDFFTKEIDQLQLQGFCRLGIHSAKDLPDPMTPGLKVIALTRCLNASDSLVFREEESLEILSSGALIGVSCERREKAVLAMRPDVHCIDIRGTIDQRLAKLDQKMVDAVVVAEAALIRLQLTHRNRLLLKGETAPLQGQLAVVSREEDLEMQELFACIDARRSK